MNIYRVARTFVAVIALALSASAASADSGGMYLCPSAIIANALWAGFGEAQATGADKSSLREIAARRRCPFIQSDQLKPKDYALGQLMLSDGKRGGWAATQYYVLYFNQNGPRPPNHVR